MSRVRGIALLLLVMLSSQGSMVAQAVLNARYGYTIEPLVEWILDETTSSSDRMVFFSPKADMHLIIMVELLGEGSLLEQYKLNNEGVLYSSLIEMEEFFFNKKPALLALIRLHDSNEDILAYSLSITNNRYKYHLLFVAENSVLENNLATVFSVLDSFALTDTGITRGPISQFDYQLNGRKSAVMIDFNDQRIEVMTDLNQFDAAQRIVEREASIMSQYKVRNELAYLAWIRYYRAVYRDNYERVTPIYDSIRHQLPPDELEVAKMLLKYSQDYQYSRLDTPSDLNAPIVALLDKRGDCDSMALSYLILLNHHGINGALFLSQNMAHTVAGVQVKSDGFKIEVLNESFVIAELTTKDELGHVPLAVSNNRDWFPLFFRGS